TTISVAQMPKASAPRKRKGVIIQDPKEAAIASVIMHSEAMSKDKGKGILVEDPKPLKRQAQIKHDEAYARELEAELNANINWNDVIEQVKMKEKQDNTVMRYQPLKRKPITEAHERKNMMIYLKNMAGFKMEFFRGMTYTEIRLVFEKNYTSIKAFLEKREKEIEEDGSKRKSDSPEQKAAKSKGLMKKHLLLTTEFIMNTTSLTSRSSEQMELTKPKNFSDDFLLHTLKAMFEKPNVKASIWRDQRGRYGLAKVKSWKLLESYGVHVLTLTTTQMILLVEKKYPLTIFTLEQMLNNARLEVEEESEMSLELLSFGVDAVEHFKEIYAKGLLLLVEDLMMLVQVKIAR
nr:hypothetical protein [Tanacetum cinerariifolium]